VTEDWEAAWQPVIDAVGRDFGSGEVIEGADAVEPSALRRYLDEFDRDANSFEIVLGGPVIEASDIERWEALGVTRLIVSPWRRSKEAVAGVGEFAARFWENTLG